MDVDEGPARQRYESVVAAGRGLLVALDFDGTLSPIVSDPESAVIHPAAGEVLAGLVPKLAALAVVTGRPVRQVLRLGGLDELADRVPEARLLVAGQYGEERWDSRDRVVTAPAPPEGLRALREELPAALARSRSTDAWVEEKGLAIAVHTRRAADPEGSFSRLLPELTDLAGRHGLTVEPGRLVVELRAGRADKGAALRALVEELAATAVVFGGDDLGDLPAFEAVCELRDHGMPGLLVCSASEEQPALAERADLVVDGPDGVLRLLAELAADLGDAR